MSKYIKLFLVLFLVIFGLHVCARENLDLGKHITSDCSMNETVTLNIQFQGMVDKTVDVKSEIDKAEEKVIAIGKELELEKIQIQSQNFSINTQKGYQMSRYQYSGNISLLVAPYNDALNLMERMQQLNYQVSLNANRYGNGNCR